MERPARPSQKLEKAKGTPLKEAKKTEEKKVKRGKQEKQEENKVSEEPGIVNIYVK